MKQLIWIMAAWGAVYCVGSTAGLDAPQYEDNIRNKKKLSLSPSAKILLKIKRLERQTSNDAVRELTRISRQAHDPRLRARALQALRHVRNKRMIIRTGRLDPRFHDTGSKAKKKKNNKKTSRKYNMNNPDPTRKSGMALMKEFLRVIRPQMAGYTLPENPEKMKKHKTKKSTRRAREKETPDQRKARLRRERLRKMLEMIYERHAAKSHQRRSTPLQWPKTPEKKPRSPQEKRSSPPQKNQKAPSPEKALPFGEE